MVLSNAERQARYRERLRQLAAKGVMSPAQNAVLSGSRRHLREWRRSLAAFAQGRMWLTTINEDETATTAAHTLMVRRYIAQHEALLAQFDPDDLTADGNVEIGDVTPSDFGGVYAGRWVAYCLDEQGRAVNLRLYDAESHARNDAAKAAGRHAGVIADDMWSISPPSEYQVDGEKLDPEAAPKVARSAKLRAHSGSPHISEERPLC